MCRVIYSREKVIRVGCNDNKRRTELKNFDRTTAIAVKPCQKVGEPFYSPSVTRLLYLRQESCGYICIHGLEIYTGYYTGTAQPLEVFGHYRNKEAVNATRGLKTAMFIAVYLFFSQAFPTNAHLDSRSVIITYSPGVIKYVYISNNKIYKAPKSLRIIK